MSIKIKSITIFLLITLIPLLAVGWIDFHLSRKHLKDSKLEKMEALADLKVSQIEFYYKERMSDMKTAQDYYNVKTNLPILTEFFDDKESEEYINAKKMLDSQLKTFQRAYEYTNVMLVSPQGKIVYSTNNYYSALKLGNRLNDPLGLAFARGSNGFYISEIFRDDEGGRLVQLITAPVISFDGDFAGVVAFEINMDTVYDLVQDTSGLGRTGETLIGTKIESDVESGYSLLYEKNNDYVLFLNTLRHSHDAPLNLKVDMGADYAIPIQEAVEAKANSGFSIDYRGESIIAAWRYIPIVDWGLVAKIDSSEALREARDLQRTLFLVGLLSALFVIILAWLITRTFSEKLDNLVNLTNNIANGNFSVDLKSSSRKDEIGRLINSIYKMSRTLKNKDKDKYIFINSASHQLRTPISATAMQLELLIDELKQKKNKTLAKKLEEIYTSNERAATIMSDMFSYLELSSDFTPDKLKQFLLKPLVDNILSSYEKNIKAKKLDIKIDIKPTLKVYAQEQYFKLAIIQLIDNAITYSDQKGKIKILAKYKKDKVYFEISDNGIGLREEDKKYLFNTFFRAKNAYSKKNVGTGLGLVIVKRVVEGLEGNVGFDSEENKGFTFYFEIPKKE